MKNNSGSSGEKQAGGLADHDFRVATAALLVHAATVNGDMSEAERDKLHSLLKQRFELDDAAASVLIEEAVAADDKAVDLFHFTHLLNERLDDNDRLRRFIEDELDPREVWAGRP